MRTRTRGRGLPASAATAALLAACSPPDSNSTGSGHSPARSDRKLSIGFFGFAKANSFASATFAGISEYAAKNNATATFVDPNFDAQTQVQQLQDAVTAKRYDVIIVQANDGTAVVPAVQQAVRAGITVVVEFTPIGTRYDTVEPQVDGTITIIDIPTKNGAALGTLGLRACKAKAVKPCKVAYLQGFKVLPLDNARTNAALATLKADPDVQVVADVEGGYTQDAGRKAFQDVLQANPDVNVVIGSSQAIEGASALAKGKDIAFIGNGGSTQAVTAVQNGDWFAAYVIPEKTEGAKAAELGLKKARGEQVPTSLDASTLTPFNGLGTRENLRGVTAEYSD
jgi:ribose transport system substrate-binding protein